MDDGAGRDKLCVFAFLEFLKEGYNYEWVLVPINCLLSKHV